VSIHGRNFYIAAPCTIQLNHTTIAITWSGHMHACSTRHCANSL